MWDDLAIDGYAELVSCVACGMVYHQTVCTESDFSRYYSQNGYYAAAETTGSGGFGYDESLRYQRIYSLLAPHLTNNNPCIVDIGSGKGGFLHWCQDQGFNNLIAVEKSAQCADAIKQSLEIPVFSDVFGLAADRQKIDIVILSHVLEHAFCPAALLTALLAVTDENTLFYLEVPNATFYVSEPNPWQYLYFEHINHFDLIHLEALLNRLGMASLSKTHDYFLPNQENFQECCIVVAKKAISEERKIFPDNQLSKLMQEKLSFMPAVFNQLILDVNEKNKFISIWGISQYAQLVIAKHPCLSKHLRYLIDKSPAKCGRFLNGHRVEALDKLSELGERDTLLIPQNIFSAGMADILYQAGFSGRRVLF